MLKINIIINLKIEGIHSWPECPIPEVSFLKNNHRHIFYITCKKEVSHSDRDIEIIMLKRTITQFLETKYKGVFGRMSCEDIGLVLINKFDLNYCKILEDNENGAEIYSK